MHGANGGAPVGNRNAYKHGRYSRDAIDTRRMIKALIREADETVELV